MHKLASVLLDLFFPEGKKEKRWKSVKVVIKFSQMQNSYFLPMCYVS